MNQRELFEKWAKNPPMEFYLARHDDTAAWPGNYKDYHVECAWQAWQAAIAAQWQPISTAPEDGTSILAYTAEGQCEASWHGLWVQSPCYATYDGCGAADLLCDPTHWMPLPPEPTK